MPNSTEDDATVRAIAAHVSTEFLQHFGKHSLDGECTGWLNEKIASVLQTVRDAERERDAGIAKKPCIHAIGTCEDMAGCHKQVATAIRQPEGR